MSPADTFANSLGPDQARQNAGPDQDQNCLTHSDGILERFFSKKLILKKKSTDDKKHTQLPSRQIVNMLFTLMVFLKEFFEKKKDF